MNLDYEPKIKCEDCYWCYKYSKRNFKCMKSKERHPLTEAEVLHNCSGFKPKVVRK